MKLKKFEKLMQKFEVSDLIAPGTYFVVRVKTGCSPDILLNMLSEIKLACKPIGIYLVGGEISFLYGRNENCFGRKRDSIIAYFSSAVTNCVGSIVSVKLSILPSKESVFDYFRWRFIYQRANIVSKNIQGLAPEKASFFSSMLHKEKKALLRSLGEGAYVGYYGRYFKSSKQYLVGYDGGLSLEKEDGDFEVSNLSFGSDMAAELFEEYFCPVEYE